ncbi:MAG: protein translocase subunit SecD, partial [Prevotellaceae bacterium]|nr:protein translocase subunit SecD [Prevotellaceae bacterium]
MQNKGIVKVFAVLLILVCAFYLSFSFVTSHYTGKAAKYANGDVAKEQFYMDSLANQKVWLGSYTLRECREMEIGLGLDLKGGMNVILEVSVADVVKALADGKSDELFNQALASASRLQRTSQDDFISLFIREYRRVAPDARLAELFATQKLKDKVTQRSSDSEVEAVLRTEVQSAIDNSFNVLRTRIDRFGVVQPNIQRLEGGTGRIMIELPGIKEPERVRKLLQGSANLEFFETYNASEVLSAFQISDTKLRTLLTDPTLQSADAADAIEAEQTQNAAAQATTSTPSAATRDSLLASVTGTTPETSANDEQIRKQYPLLSILSLNSTGQGPVIGYAHYRDTATINKYLTIPEIKAEFPRELRVLWGVAPMGNGEQSEIYELYAIKVTDRTGNAPLTGEAVDDASDTFDQFGRPVVSMSMNTEGSRKWAQLTAANIGRSIAIVLDSYVYSAPTVNTEITGGRSEISGQFTPEQTKDLANVLKSGKMPAPTRIVQEDIIGPSLGQESINAGLISFVLSMVLLLLYICAVYGVIPGLIAYAALLFNIFFTMGILASFQAALTMSGLAGIVLTLGMAVDANVLIYERTKEELRAGKVVKKALSDGYSNAFSAIFDSNFTSLITG